MHVAMEANGRTLLGDLNEQFKLGAPNWAFIMKRVHVCDGLQITSFAL